ncbi:hypothetical protein HZS_2771 [Henneguya salminicola]|nr:hypothetical protein HZS_2771 [Henneguya salminicola]
MFGASFGYDKSSKTCLHRFQNSLIEAYSHVTSISTLPNKNILITSDLFGFLYLFSSFSGSPKLYNYLAHDNSVYSTLIHGDNILSGSKISIRRWSIINNQENLVGEYKLSKIFKKTAPQPYVNDMEIIGVPLY